MFSMKKKKKSQGPKVLGISLAAAVALGLYMRHRRKMAATQPGDPGYDVGSCPCGDM